MKVYRDLNEVSFPGGTAVTVGSFDGMHRGHMELINTLLSIAKEMELTPVVVTFANHPRNFMEREGTVELLTTTEEKLMLFLSAGVENVVLLPFDEGFRKMDFRIFMKDVLVGKLAMKEFVVGYNHHFGHNKEGNSGTLGEISAQLGIGVHVVGRKDLGELKISSTAIRDALREGDIKTANDLLGYSYFATGRLMDGGGDGELFFIPAGSDKLLPNNGTYEVTLRQQDVEWTDTAYIIISGIRLKNTRSTPDDKAETVMSFIRREWGVVQ